MVTEKIAIVGHQFNTLLIEDNHVVQQTHYQILRKIFKKVKITKVDTQLEALQQAFAQRFDLIIADLSLVDNNSAALVINLRQLPSLNPKTPLLIVTSYDNSLIKTRCLRAGASEFLIKPLSKKSLENSLKKIIVNKDFFIS